MTHEEILKVTQNYYENTDDNIIGVGYGYKTINGVLTNEKSIVFTVKEKLPIEQLTKDQILPKSINVNNEIIFTDVVKGNYKLMYNYSFCNNDFYNWRTVPCSTQTFLGIKPNNRNSFRPLKCGVSTTNYTSLSGYVGTLGFLAKDNETNSLVGVTNNHVLVNDAFICSERDANGYKSNIKDDIVVQAHPFDSGGGGNIGVVKKYYPITDNSYNYVDVALTTINSSVVDSTSYQQVGLVPTTLPFASTSEINNLLSTNTLLYSAGRTTGAKGEGLTKLKIRTIAITLGIGYLKQGVVTYVDFTDCIEFVAVANNSTDPLGENLCFDPINHGDSGSALIADIGGTRKIIGLVFAGTSPNQGDICDTSPDPLPGLTGIACRIDHIASLMNISAWNGEAINYSNTSNILELDVPGLDNRPYIDHVDGKRYWQVGLKNN